jgi:hypothetical protein
MGRKGVKEAEKKTETIGVAAAPALKERVEEVAAEHERSISWVAGALLARGLALYEKDGKLKDKEK